jgi:UDP-N-acetylmuramate--alanine ligase
MEMFFCGIAGSGMAPIAMLLQKQGVKISGSDRLNDKSENLSILEKLKALKINIFPQDGSGITTDTDCLVFFQR